MAMSSVSKFSIGKDEKDLRLELLALRQTRETLVKFLEAVRCVRSDLETLTTNHVQLKQINQQWVALLTSVNRSELNTDRRDI